MATSRNDSAFTGFVGNAASADAIRREFIDGPMAGARQEAAATGLEFLDLMMAIPRAIMASQRREIDRLVKTRGDKDPAVVRMQAELARNERMAAVAAAGQTRIRRGVEIAGNRGAAFQGFVSDASLAPLEGLTVRIVSNTRTGGDGLSATTGEDGYFRIPIDAAAAVAGTSGGEREIVVGQKQTATVEIADRGGTIVHRDPEPLPVGEAAYREYVVEPSGAAGERSTAAEG
jgi:hypothetical protein